jgi:adenylate cyclase
MNDYYAALFEPIKANDGMVLQVVGDSVMALWSAPAPDDGLKRAACQAAIGIAAAVKRFNDQAGPHAMPTRIGIHAGEMLLGNIGAMSHFEYRPVGDIVNTASRLEGLNKFLGTQMLVSAAAAPADGSVRLRPLGRFVFKGKAQPVSVHELRAADLHPAEEQAALDRFFADGLDAFRRRHWDEAGRLFDQAWQRDPGDGPSRFYRRYSAALGHQPPAADWDGAVRLEAK